MRKILVLDTTLRDGEQSPGAKLNTGEKLDIASQLTHLGVDIIEAGFPASSPGDFQSVERIAAEVGDRTAITALARAVPSDIDAVYGSIKGASSPIIHIVLGSSDIHIEKKFRRSREQVLQLGMDAVAYAKRLLPDVQYSTEDASRSDFEYLWQTIEGVVKAGATIINVPDTVGYAVPDEFGHLIFRINDRLKNLNDRLILSVHCHNDLGLATANTLAAVKNGADKVECTVNGVGERAGNASLEEIVMSLHMRRESFKAYTDIRTKEIGKTSRMVSTLMGLDVQANKAIVGENAFAHSSGIHQDGLLKSRDAYEIIRPEDVGAEGMELVLTARSGRHAVKNGFAQLGYDSLSQEDFEGMFDDFLELADRKKEIFLFDLYFLMEKYFAEKNQTDIAPGGITNSFFELVEYQAISNSMFPSASVHLRRGTEDIKRSSSGDGPIDALYSAIREASGIQVELLDYKIRSISVGKEAPGRVSIRLKYEGDVISARALDTDVIRASAVAFLNGINQVVLKSYRNEERRMVTQP